MYYTILYQVYTPYCISSNKLSLPPEYQTPSKHHSGFVPELFILGSQKMRWGLKITMAFWPTLIAVRCMPLVCWKIHSVVHAREHRWSFDLFNQQSGCIYIPIIYQSMIVVHPCMCQTHFRPKCGIYPEVTSPFVSQNGYHLSTRGLSNPVYIKRYGQKWNARNIWKSTIHHHSMSSDLVEYGWRWQKLRARGNSQVSGWLDMNAVTSRFRKKKRPQLRYFKAKILKGNGSNGPMWPNKNPGKSHCADLKGTWHWIVFTPHVSLDTCWQFIPEGFPVARFDYWLGPSLTAPLAPGSPPWKESRRVGPHRYG